MSADTPMEVFRRAVHERYHDLKRFLDQLLAEFGLARNVDATTGLAKQAYQQAQALRLILPKDHQPGWLAQIQDALRAFCENPQNRDNASRLNKTIAKHWAAMDTQKWEFEEGPTPFDFDGVYNKYFSQSKIPELFDELIGLLEQVLSETDEDGRYVINQRHAVETLRTLIATLKKNRQNPSHSTLVFIWRASRLFVENTLWKALQEYTVLKVLIPVFQKTMQELDKQVIAVDKKTKEEVKKAVSVELPMLEYHSYALLEYVAEESGEEGSPE